MSHLYTWIGGPFLPSLAQRLMATNEYDGVPSEGGLFHATFLPLDQQGNQLAPREEDGTLFYKTNPWNSRVDAELRT